MNNILTSFLDSIIVGKNGNEATAIVIKEKLIELNKFIVNKEKEVTILKNNIFSNLTIIDETACKNYISELRLYQKVQNKNINLFALNKSYSNLEISDKQTIIDFKETIATEVLNLFSVNENANTNINFKKIIDIGFDYYILLSFEDDTTIDVIVETKKAIVDILEEFKIIAANSTQKETMEGYIGIALNLLNFLFENVLQPAKNKYATNQSIYNNLKPTLVNIEEDLKKIPLPKTLDFKNTSIADVWDAGNEFVSISEYDEIQEVFQKSKKGVEKLFEIVNNITPDNPDLKHALKNLKDTLLDCLTLPTDFRAENLVEAVHFVVTKIKNTTKKHLSELGTIGKMIHSKIEILESLLCKIDNEDFKLLITPKENLEIHEIELPKILEDEPDTTVIEDKGTIITPILKGNKPKNTTTADKATDPTQDSSKTKTGNKTETDTETLPPLTIEAIIEHLCFYENPDADPKDKLSDESRNVIHDLYYRTWLSERRYKVEHDVQDFFDIQTLKPIWEELKALLLNEDGVNLGKIIEFVIDNGVALVNKLIAFVKDSITYILDELFMLIKAIIEFFRKANLPPVAIDLLKKIPPFENLPQDVTLLHVIAAIPYSIYLKFIPKKEK